MAIKNFRDAISNNFPFTGNGFAEWWSKSYNQFDGITVGSNQAYTNATQNGSINIGGTVYTIYILTKSSQLTWQDAIPHFYFFKAYNSNSNDMYCTTKKYYQYASSSSYDSNDKLFKPYTSTYKLKWTGDSSGINPIFRVRNSTTSNVYAIQLTKGSTKYYYVIAVEVDQTKEAVTLQSENFPVPSSFKPYQTISFTSQPTGTFKISQTTINSNSETSSSSTTTTVNGQLANAYGTIPNGSVSYTLSYGSKYISRYVSISDWDSKTYSIVATGSSYSLYTGQTVGQDFLNAFKVQLVCSNDYHTETTYPQTSLQLSLMSKTMPLESDVSFTFTYNISSFTISGDTSIQYTISSFHKLASGDTKFNAIECETNYELGDVIEDRDMSEVGSLTYDDGTTISLGNYSIVTTSMTCSAGNLPYTITGDTPHQFSITYNWNILGIGNLQKTFVCETGGTTFPDHVVLNNEDHIFTPNQIIKFGDSAYLDVYNGEGTIIRTIQSANFNTALNNIDNRYGKIAKDYQIDNGLTLTSFYSQLQISHKIGFTYYDDLLTLNTSAVVKDYIMDEDTFTDFDYTGLVVSIKKHTSTYNNGVITTNVTTTTLSSAQYTISHDPLDFTQRKSYIITITYTDEYGIVHTGTFQIMAEPLMVTGFSVSGSPDSIKYYDNNSELFKYPTNLVVTVVYNDPTYNYQLQDLTTLTYYRDETHDTQLIVGTSVIARSAGDKIYFRSNALGVNGSFHIIWLQDTIQQVSIVNAVTLYLGNKLKTAKSQFTLRLTYISGVQTTTNDPNSYEFEYTQPVLSEMSTINVIIIGSGTFALSNVDTMVTWANPVAKIVLDLNNFQTEYNNTVDVIYPNGIGAKVEYYQDNAMTIKCDYEQALTYSSISTQAYDKFTVSGLDDLTNYNFGSQILNITMSGVSEVTERIQINAVNRFLTSSAGINTTTNVKVIEILNITGIKLLYAKTEYYIGEEFLNANDNTEIMIFYDDPQNQHRTYTCYLRSGLTALNIYPLKGTILNTIVSNKVITITSATNYNVSVQYSINVRANYVYDDTTKHNLVALFLQNYVCPDGVSRSKYFLVERTIEVDGYSIETTKIDPNTGDRVINDGFDVDELDIQGFLEDISDTSKNARVILFKDYISPIEGSNNITVKFPCYVDGNADFINKSHFGIMFGNNNAKNRLFVSGNSEYRNKDWHSSEVNSEYIDDDTMISGNYGYFEDLSECIYGETDNAVIGYDIVSNDKLLVLKNKSDKETTVYFRQPQLVTAINNSGTAVTGLDGETLYQEEFSLVKGNNSVAGISPKAIINFNGDTLFVSSDNQVVGLDLTGIIGDNQRYANSRSYYMDEELKTQDLSKCFMWTNNSYLFLVLPHKIYVTYYELKSETQYEWFVLDIDDICSIIEVNNVIYFGNSKGELYKFTETYKDAKKFFAGYGVTRMTVNEETEILVAVGDLSNIDLTKKYMFRPIPFTDMGVDDDQYIYYCLGIVQNNSSANCDFYVDNSDTRNVIKLVCNKNGSMDIDRFNLMLKRISETTPVFLNHVAGETIIQCKSGSDLANAWGKPYYLKEYDGANSLEHLYQLIDENGNVAPVKDLYRARLCLRITNELEMSDINKQTGTFKLKDEGEIIDIVQYNAQSLITAFKGEIIEYKNVEAFYITKPYDMGNLEYFKTVWSFTLTNDSNIPSELELCYANNKIPYENMKTLAKISKDILGFDIASFNFAKVDFDKNIVPRTYTNKRILSGVKFLCFGFRNLNDTNSVLSSLNITYTLPYPSYGGD